MATIETKARALVELRKAISDLEAQHDAVLAPMKAQRDELQADMLDHLTRTKQLSIRYDFATVVRAVRKRCVVMDEGALIAHLKASGLASEYVCEGLAPAAETLLKEAAKGDTVRDLPGTAIEEKEYISIKLPTSEGDKRKQAHD